MRSNGVVVLRRRLTMISAFLYRQARDCMTSTPTERNGTIFAILFWRSWLHGAELRNLSYYSRSALAPSHHLPRRRARDSLRSRYGN